jgi:MFS superfamily sulfate permease-like transporter
MAGALVLLALAFLTPMFFYIPDAALAAVIIMAVSDIIDFSMVPHLWRIKSMTIIAFLHFFQYLIDICFNHRYML